MNNNSHTNTTLDLINDLLQNVPDIDYQLKNLSKTKLLESISVMIFNKGKHFLKHILSKIRNPNNPDYNPNYKFSIKGLKIAEENIKEKYGPSSELVPKNIEKFRYINRDLKNYFHEQWRKYNPNLKSRFFKRLDTPEKTYWFGFLCSDGSITSGNDPSKKRYQISIEISKKDRSHLVKFCRAVGLNPTKIGERTKILDIPEAVIWSYREQYIVEHAFRDMKSPTAIAVRPMYHHADTSIRAHVFLCVISLLLLSLLRLKLARKSVPTSYNEFLYELRSIHVLKILTSPKAKPLWKLEKITKNASKFFRALILRRLLAN